MTADYSPMLNKLIRREDLSGDEAARFMSDCMDGNLSPVQAGAVLTALSMKGESIEEIAACARIMREKATRIDVGSETVVDCVGTGGDGSGTFNISTAAGLLVAAAGHKVAKHGNRSVTSRCGSADVIEALGVDLNAPPEKVAQTVREIGFGFLFAPRLHAAMKNVVPIRKDLKIRTVFNILGPMTNPAGANALLIGLFAEELLTPVARALKSLGTRSFYVIHGENGMDEITGASNAFARKMFRDGEIESFTFKPEEHGFSRCSPEDLKGGDAKENAQIIKDVFRSDGKSPKAESVIMNAGFALSAAENISLREGFDKAAATLSSGRAAKFLERYLNASSA